MNKVCLSFCPEIFLELGLKSENSVTNAKIQPEMLLREKYQLLMCPNDIYLF